MAYRFRKVGGLEGGATAIVALLHDLIIVYGVFVLLRSDNIVKTVLGLLRVKSGRWVRILTRENTDSADSPA